MADQLVSNAMLQQFFVKKEFFLYLDKIETVVLTVQNFE
jgi:hypothetical protein